MNSGEIMNSNDLTLAIFSIILIVIAIFLFIYLKIFRKKRENKKPPETNPLNETPLRNFVSLHESAKGNEKELNKGPTKEEIRSLPAIFPSEENANLKLEDTLAENEVKTAHDVIGKKVNRNKKQAAKKTEKIGKSTLNKKTKPEELSEKKPVTKPVKIKNPNKEVAKPAIKESEEKSPDKESSKKVRKKNRKPTNA
jgi:FtsZ-interacting cell division protein ZipA